MRTIKIPHWMWSRTWSFVFCMFLNAAFGFCCTFALAVGSTWASLILLLSVTVKIVFRDLMALSSFNLNINFNEQMLNIMKILFSQFVALFILIFHWYILEKGRVANCWIMWQRLPNEKFGTTNKYHYRARLSRSIKRFATPSPNKYRSLLATVL